VSSARLNGRRPDRARLGRAIGAVAAAAHWTRTPTTRAPDPLRPVAYAVATPAFSAQPLSPTGSCQHHQHASRSQQFCAPTTAAAAAAATRPDARPSTALR